MKPVLFLLLCWGQAGFAAGGPIPQAGSPDAGQPMNSKTEEVVVDAIVRDKKGRAITDLKQGDFAVFDNGQPRPIQSFRLVQGTSSVNASGGRRELDPMHQIRLVTFIFDRMDIDGLRLSKQAAMDMLGQDLPQNVYMAVYALDQKLEALQPFTNSRDLLQKAIARATSGPATNFAGVNGTLTEQLENLTGPNTSGKQDLEERVDAMPVTADENGAENGWQAMDKLMASIMLQTLRFDQRSDLSNSDRSNVFGLLAAVKGQYGLPGRKTILYFSNGFVLSQGMEAPFKSVISTANRFNVSFYAIDTHGLSTMDQNAAATSQLAAAASASRENQGPQPIGDNHITTETALSADTAIDSGRYNTQDTLAILANQTGGFLVANTNDFRAPLHKISEDISTYYEITYYPQLDKYDGSFRKISVKTSRADLRVQSRSGYYALPVSMLKPGGELSAYQIPLLQALSNPTPQLTFPFESGGLHFRSDGRNQTCEFLIEIPLKALTLTEDKSTNRLSGGLSYVAYVRDEAGEVVKKLEREFPVQMSPDQMLAFHQTRFTDMEYFDVPPGRYTIETAVLDRESGKTSARKSFVLVPKPAPTLALSSISLIRSWKAKAADATDDDPFVFGDKMMTPILDPMIRKSASTSLPFYMVIYPDPNKTDKPELVMEFNRDGKVTRVGSAAIGSPDAQGRIQYVATAPIDQLQPGNYAVRFIVKQGSEAVQEAYSLTLEP